MPAALCQDDRDRVIATSPQNQEPAAPSKHLFGLIPNNNAANISTTYQPLTWRQKFRMAASDAFDPGTFVMAATLAGKAMLLQSAPSYGQGVVGYSRYLGASVGDFVIGDYLTEAVFPTLFRQDPRYFQSGVGSGWSRLGHAVGQTFWTRKDSGGYQFNYSELVGNASAVAISNAYYPDSRNAPSALGSFAIQLALDTAGNVLKEFAPDIGRLLSRKKKTTSPDPQH